MKRVHDIQQKVDEAAQGYDVSLESLLQVGFNQFRKAPGELIIYSILCAFALSNPLSGLLLGGPLVTGYFIYAHGLKFQRSVEFSRFFRSFDRFTPLLLLHLLIGVIVALGLLLLIIPGIYFSISYMFAYFFVWFYGVDPTEAIRMSRKMVSGNFTQMLFLWLMLAALNLAGALAFGVGLLITLPLSGCILYAAFDDIIGTPNW